MTGQVDYRYLKVANMNFVQNEFACILTRLSGREKDRFILFLLSLFGETQIGNTKLG